MHVFDRVWLYYAFSVSACWGIVFVRSHSESACVYMCRFVYKCVSLCVCHCAVYVTKSPVMVCAQVCLLMAPKWLSVWSSTSPVGKSEGSIAEHEQCHRCFTFEHAWITLWLSQKCRLTQKLCTKSVHTLNFPYTFTSMYGFRNLLTHYMNYQIFLCNLKKKKLFHLFHLTAPKSEELQFRYTIFHSVGFSGIFRSVFFNCAFTNT